MKTKTLINERKNFICVQKNGSYGNKNSTSKVNNRKIWVPFD